MVMQRFRRLLPRRTTRRTLLLAVYVLLSATVFAAAVVGLTLAFHRKGTSTLEQLNWASQSIVGIVALASIVFVGIQISDVRRSLGSSAFEATASRILEITRLSLQFKDEYAELHRDGEPSLGSKLLAEAYLDILDTELVRRRALPDAWADELPSLNDWIKDLFVELPGLRFVLSHRRSWYSGELFAMMPGAPPAEEENTPVTDEVASPLGHPLTSG
ncbi:hypothetical protein ACFOW4_14640 [Micromonospora sp. GCM10011542]|uniref:hypothetical protein n=1 Tax=Micromonospora sp. GCM10011542 TaxID=3317337 RepID=UPI003616819D